MKRLLYLIAILFLSTVNVNAQIIGQVNINTSDLQISEQYQYAIIGMKGAESHTKQTGAPKLPAIVRTFVVPTNAKVIGIDIKENSRIALDGTFLPYPTQPPVKIGDEKQEFIPPIDSIYNGKNSYPATRAEIVADYNQMGYHLVSVQLYPIEFEPMTKKIYLHSFGFTLRYQDGPVNVKQPLAQSENRTTLIKKMIKSMVCNPQDVDRFSDANKYGKAIPTYIASTEVKIPSLEKILSEQIPDYIIITNKTLKSEFQRLANWKIQKGVPTIIKDIDEINTEYIGSDLPEKIHAYLHECRNKWGEGLFVLLGGDTEIVPTRMYNHNGEGLSPSDAYYADLNSDWNSNKNNLYAENKNDGAKLEYHCIVGRASVENVSEAKTFVDKILSYEKLDNTKVNTNYLMNHLAAAAYNKKASNGFLSDGGKSSINIYLSKYTQLTKWYLFEHFNCDCNKHISEPKYEAGEELNKNSFLSALNGETIGLEPFHIVYHQDHCTPRTMGASNTDKGESLYIGDIDNLKNGNYFQIMISDGCYPVQFNEDCIAEHFLNNPNGGTVAFIGNAGEGYAGEHYHYKKFLECVYDDSISLNAIGGMVYYMSSYGIFSGYGSGSLSSYVPCFLRFHLLGDPEMPVWSAVPQEFDVDVTTGAAPNNQRKISVQINNLPEGEEATVCLMKDEDFYERIVITDTDKHEFTFLPKHSTGIKVTVTARNFIPYEKNLPAVGSMDRHLEISSLNGFSKSVAIGDSADIAITIANHSDKMPATMAMLTSSSPYVTVATPVMDYGGLKDTATRTFRIRVSKDAPEIMRNEWNAACLSLTMRGYDSPALNMTDVDTFRIDIVSPRLRISSVKVLLTSDWDKTLEAGENVMLGLSSVKLGKYSSSQPLKWTVEPLPDCKATVKQITNNTCIFNIGSSYKNGNPLKFKIKLLDGTVPQDSIEVDVAETLPTIDATKVHYSATEKAISFYWDAMSSATKFNIYRSSSENGSYTKLNKTPLTTRYFEDEDIEDFTTYYYKLSALTDGYLEGEKSEAFSVKPPCPVSFYKILSAPCSFDNDAYTADIDFDGQKEIVQVGEMSNNNVWTSLLTVVKPDGTEPYDIDGNVTSFSGYAEFPCLIQAGATVADLYGRGEPSIITVPRGAYSTDGKFYATCYSSQDKDGDKLPDKLWQTDVNGYYYRSAVVTDIDRPDGKGHKEVILLEETGKGIAILNANGTVKRTIGAGTISGNYSTPAVADLDGDGYKEIICGAMGGVYVWKHDGTAFGQQPLLAKAGRDLRSSPVVCDLDGDGQKEIVIAERDKSQTDYIYAIKPNGTCLTGFDGSSEAASIHYPNDKDGEGLDHGMTVGDINGDGYLEVLSLGHGCVKAWTRTGTTIIDRELPDLFEFSDWNNHRPVPLIADIDGDEEPEIVFSDRFTIYAIHADGTDVTGFPMASAAEIFHGISVSDIDADGKNEIIAPDAESGIKVWKTEGKGITWGRARFDTGNTGEYVEGGSDPLVLTESQTWSNTTVNSDIIVRSGTLTLPQNRVLTMRPGCKLIVMDGGKLNLNGGIIENADIRIKTGGTLVIDNHGVIYLDKYGDVTEESGATFDFILGDILPQPTQISAE